MTRVAVLGDGVTASAIRWFVGQCSHYELSDVPEADLVVTSPGIPPKNWPNVPVDIISDIEFAYRVLKKEYHLTFIGVTGTNGKTTVASGIAQALDVDVYGNIGTPLIRMLPPPLETRYVVLELSSYQLYSSPTLHCDIAIILNVEPDHLEWHGTFDAYKQAKKCIVKSRNQRLYVPKTMAVELNEHSDVQIIEHLTAPNWPQFNGPHNQLNAAVIQDVAMHCGASKVLVNDRMKRYALPKFRCEPIASPFPMTIINDSKATNPSATLAAIGSTPGDKVLILSGEPKFDYDADWMREILSNCKVVYATGGLSQNRHVFPEEFWPQLVFYSHLKDAVLDALKYAVGGTLLFSPSAASFDEFSNYMERGHAFNAYINRAI